MLINTYYCITGISRFVAIPIDLFLSQPGRIHRKCVH